MQRLKFTFGKIVCSLVMILGTTSMLLGPCHGPAYQPNVPNELKK